MTFLKGAAIAAAFAASSFLSAAQAASTSTTPYLGMLGYGGFGVAITSTEALPAFSEEVRFDLAHDSILTGQLTGVALAIAQLRTVAFNEATGQYDYTLLKSVNVADDGSFSLGTWTATEGLVGISVPMYSLSVFGAITGAGNSASLTLNVSPAVPEPASWALMGLGLVGVAAVARRRRTLAA